MNKSEYIEALSLAVRKSGITQTEFAKRVGESRQLVNMAFQQRTASIKLIKAMTAELNKQAMERGEPGRFSFREFVGLKDKKWKGEDRPQSIPSKRVGK